MIVSPTSFKLTELTENNIRGELCEHYDRPKKIGFLSSNLVFPYKLYLVMYIC